MAGGPADRLRPGAPCRRRAARAVLGRGRARAGTGPGRGPGGLTVPGVVLKNVPFDVTVKDPSGRLAEGSTVTLAVGERTYTATLAGGEATIEGVTTDRSAVQLALTDGTGAALGSATTTAIPGFLSLVPALLAIVIALAFRQVLPALVLGIWIGGALAVVVGTLPAGYGAPWWLVLPLAAVILLLGLRYGGELAEDVLAPPAAAAAGRPAEWIGRRHAAQWRRLSREPARRPRGLDRRREGPGCPEPSRLQADRRRARADLRPGSRARAARGPDLRRRSIRRAPPDRAPPAAQPGRLARQARRGRGHRSTISAGW